MSIKLSELASFRSGTSRGYTGSRGFIGYTGSQGIRGSGINILGSVLDVSSLPLLAEPGDSYLVDDNLWVWDGTNWTGGSPIIGFTGSQGPQGTTGFTGSQGNIGFTGSQGPQGTTGFTGSQGIQGNIGFTGSQGIQGIQGNEGPPGVSGPTIISAIARDGYLVLVMSDGSEIIGPFFSNILPVVPALDLDSGTITQEGPDLILTSPTASGYPPPTIMLVSLMRDTVDVTNDLIGLTLPNFETGSYTATWVAENSEGNDTITISGSFTAPAIAPSFASGPTISGTAETGETLTLSFTASGTEPITADIQWLKNGVVIPGETGLTYLLGTVASLDVFRADVSLTNSAGTTGFVSSNTLTAPDIGTIEGTPISILDYSVAGDDTLETVITRGSYTATVGSIIEPIPLEFSLDGGAWDEYPLSTVLTFPGEWYVREIVTSTSGATQTFTAGPMTVVGEPSASAPAILSHANTTQSTSGTDPVMNLPPSYPVGAVLVAFVGQDGSTQALSPSAGWSILAEDQIFSNYRRGILTRVATGSDDLTMTVAGEIVDAKIIALPAGSVVTVGPVANGAAASVLTYGSAAPTLWLNFVTHSGAVVGGAVSNGTPPDGYTFVGSLAQGVANSSSVAVHLAEKTSTADSETPSPYSNLAASDFHTQTIGVRF